MNILERDKSISTEQKALSINLDENKYGSIVEIGAGQEVARQFFKVGAAAGTIAKTSSAYDMTVSDAIYGKAGRYVSRERVEQMATHEFDLCIDRLDSVRSPDCTFFSYAATVTARSFKGGNECHGWINLKVQLRPKEEPCNIICHVRMLDSTNELQCEALGILGVNLIYGGYYFSDKPKWLIESLSDNLGDDRIEIDLIHFDGPGFNYIDNRLMNLHLVHAWLTRAVMFDSKGNPVVPRDTLYKKPLSVIRGSFKPPTRTHADMASAGLQQMKKKEGVDPRKTLQLAEISMSQLITGKSVDDRDFIARMELANMMGFNVLLSDYVRYFSLRSWFRRHTMEPISILMKASDANHLFDEEYYDGLEGRALEGLGKLFADNTSVIVYPNVRDGKVLTLENIKFPERLELVAKQLMQNNKLVASESHDESLIDFSARKVMESLRNGDADWESHLDKAVVEKIKAERLFGYRG